ncbi:MAG: DPP IV N-terminal domain-containing protein, partial [Terriglobales bacterium]
YDAQHLEIENLELLPDDSGIRFSLSVRKDARMAGETKPPEIPGTNANSQETRDVYFEYTLATGQVRRLDAYTPPEYPLWVSLSPDRQTVLFARGDNLYLMDAANYAKAVKDPADASIQEVQLTTDGVPKYSYARPTVPEEEAALKKQDKKDADNPKGMRRPAIAIHWSQDGKKFALVRQDERKVAELWVIHSLAEPRPELESYSYAMPGDSNVPIPEIQIFTLASRQRIVVPQRDFPLVDPMVSIADAPTTNAERDLSQEITRSRSKLHLQGGFGRGGTSPRWLAAGSDKLYFTALGRNFRDDDVCVLDTATGAVKTLIQENSNDWMDTRPLRLVDHGQQMIWWSERDGWAHYYLYDSSGKLLNPVTSGTYMSDQIEAVDEATRTMVFTAEGHDPKIDPYFTHLYRVGLDGAGLADITPGDFNTSIAVTPDDGRYFVATSSRVNTAPVSVLTDARGEVLAHLAATDVTRLLASGYQYPEPFTVKAADGITDLYGVMYKPFNFDPKRSYPVIEYVYPGPQTESVTKAFTPKSASVPLAQLGIVVIEIGNRGGSPQRDKWYDSFGYGNLRDYGLADKRQAITELAEKYPFIDESKVGIWGHSGGGFMTAAAMLQYPTFYTAGWSESGNHDNNVYNRAWSEKNDGVREQQEANGAIKFIYTIEKNESLAA